MPISSSDGERRADPQDSDPRATALARFVADLQDLREQYGRPSYAEMARRGAHQKGTTGSKNTFNKLGSGIDAAPKPELLRGFVLSLGAAEEVAQQWERRRRDLVAELQGVRAVVPPRSPRPTRLTVAVGVTVGVVVLGALGWFLLRPVPAAHIPSAADRELNGTVRCSSGATVNGVYIDSGENQGSDFAEYEDDPDRPGYASFSFLLRHDGPYRVHVGCGGDKEHWQTDNSSPPYSAETTATTCHDDLAVASHSHVGRCDSGIGA